MENTQPPSYVNLQSLPVFVPADWRVLRHNVFSGDAEIYLNEDILYVERKLAVSYCSNLFSLDGELCGVDLINNLPLDAKQLNATLLDWLLFNQSYIPSSWADNLIVFPGTIVEDSNQDRLVYGMKYSYDEYFQRISVYLDDFWESSIRFALLLPEPNFFDR